MKNNRIYSIIIVALTIVIVLLLLKNKAPESPVDTNLPRKTDAGAIHTPAQKKVVESIDELTAQDRVVAYVQQHHELPPYYITKKEARRKGWNPAEGNLCDVLPGRAIGGDVFSNREGRLPKKAGRTWYEADLNYDCAHRNADRLLFSSDGLIYVTKDHYKTFEQQ